MAQDEKSESELIVVEGLLQDVERLLRKEQAQRQYPRFQGAWGHVAAALTSVREALDEVAVALAREKVDG